MTMPALDAEHAPEQPPAAYDAVVLASFGGPEGQDDVIPFLRNVTRGRGIPDERLEEVSHHYRHFGGVSPINALNRDLHAALTAELAARGVNLPLLWGNRNWDPYIGDVLEQAHADGHRRVLAITTSAYSSYSSCRQYREDFGKALLERNLVGKLRVDKVRQYFDHPGFIGPFVEGVTDGLAQVRAQLAESGREGRIHVLFCTHSIPNADAAASGPRDRDFEEGAAYVAQHLANARVIMERAAADESDVDWSLVYQSRSGPPSVPWLEPDVNDALAGLPANGVAGVLLVPLGFVSDHMEVVWDLDTEALETCRDLGLAAVRTPTPGTHAAFITGMADLIAERLDGGPRPAETELGPWFDVCRPDCCANQRRAVPTVAGSDACDLTVNPDGPPADAAPAGRLPRG
ncbi:ferrochelatase [Tersicoccus sp. Bi-70]|uniref:ferrochelatase n=1 Tax=Tersicoccus sp. Bi-70 TaxID=1897634 RepID=UPI0009FB3182|nr:ferrochelatase [Tersicoccus sp. Bi-70]